MKTVLIIGGYGAIGQALMAKLSSQGRSVIIAGRSLEKATSLAHHYGQTALSLDARDENAWIQARQLWETQGVALDAIVNLSGSILIKSIGSTSLADLRETLDQNLITAFLTVKYGAPLLAAGGGGNLVLMSSVAAQLGLPNHEAISAAKGAVEGLVKSSAASFAAKNVRINGVAPALVESAMSHRFLSSDVARKASAEMHPLGRFGQPDDIASVISMLIEPQCSWITGQIFAIDGGLGALKSRR